MRRSYGHLRANPGACHPAAARGSVALNPPPPGRTLTDLDAPAPPWHAPIVNPKLRAALVAGAIAGIAAGSRACVIAIADVDARADVAAQADVAVPAKPLFQVTDIPAPADAGADAE